MFIKHSDGGKIVAVIKTGEELENERLLAKQATEELEAEQAKSAKKEKH